MSLPAPANPQLRKILLQVAEAEGPVRLFKPRSPSGGSGICVNSRDPAVRLVIPLLSTWLQEVARAPRQPRLLVLSSLGIRALVEATPPAQRPGLIRKVSSLYRERLLRVWKDLANPSELPLFHSCCAEVFGDLFSAPPSAAPTASDAAAFKRALAKELVLSWERALEPEARRGLARAMLSLGLREVGRAGEHATFTGRLHLSEEALFQGDPVEILEPGWTVTDSEGEFLLRKAQVKAISSHA